MSAAADRLRGKHFLQLGDPRLKRSDHPRLVKTSCSSSSRDRCDKRLSIIPIIAGNSIAGNLPANFIRHRGFNANQVSNYDATGNITYFPSSFPTFYIGCLFRY